jgi:MFS family permease
LVTNSLEVIALKARRALWASFALIGIVSMCWVARIPEIKDLNNLTNLGFGLVLLGSSMGSITGAQLSGRLIHSFGSRNVMRFTAITMSLGICGIAFSSHPIFLAFSLFIMGFGYSGTDLCVSVQAVALENIMSKRSMSSFHGMWSLGAFSATILGGSIANVVSPRINLIFVSLVAAVFFLQVINYLLPSELDNHDGGTDETQGKIPLFGSKVRVLWFLGFGLLGSLIAEGAAGDWGALLLRDEMGIGKGTNASAYASFALAMIVTRFFGDRAMNHFGPRKLVLFAGLIGGIGWALSIAIAVPLSDSHSLVALVIINVGFALAGFGVAPMFPAFISAASAIPGIAPSVSSARAFVIGLSGFFIGPSITGFLAEGTSISVAMAFPILSLLVAGLLSRIIK